MTGERRMQSICLRLAVLAFGFFIMFQAGSLPVEAAAKVKKAKYEGNGKVDVDFTSRVQYKNPKVTVKDSAGKVYTAKIVDRDSDDLDFVIKNFKAGRKYTYKITGIRKKGEAAYSSVSGTVSIPAAKTTALKVKKVKYDRGDSELEFDLNAKVKWYSPSVVISGGGKVFTTRITDKDSDEIEVMVKGLKRGTKYNYTIKGARMNGAKSNSTLKGTFVA